MTRARISSMRTTKSSSSISTKPKKKYIPNTSPTESMEQRNLILWRDRWANKYPVLSLLHHVPNGGFRSKRTAMMMKLEGVVKGIPDLSLPCPIGPYHGLYIELKRTVGGVVSSEQRQIIKLLQEQGYMVVICKGYIEARNVIVNYLNLDKGVLD